jgi:hypothetical protein
MAPKNTFDFQDYAVQQLDKINRKLDGMATIYMPREEINLRFAEIHKTQAETISAVASQAKTLALLKTTDDHQQGSIDTSRRITSISLTIAGLVATILFIYVTWQVGKGR